MVLFWHDGTLSAAGIMLGLIAFDAGHLFKFLIPIPIILACLVFYLFVEDMGRNL